MIDGWVNNQGINRREPLWPAVAAQVRARLSVEKSPQEVADLVEGVLREIGAVVGPTVLHQLVAEVSAEVLGAGPLQPLLDEPDVTDVLVNGPQEVWVERSGALTPVAVDLGDVNAVRQLAVRLATLAGQRLDDANPVADGQLLQGTRLHAVLPPLAGGCTLISLRVPRPRPFTLTELAEHGTVPRWLLPVLVALVETKANLLISGATGTGKTTLLAAMLGATGPGERLVVVEEAKELVIDHPHVVSLAARSQNAEGTGGVNMTALVTVALRMRPDRLILGECRGPEIREVLMAMNTGHEGSCVTLHANSAQDVVARVQALGALAGMSAAMTREQMISAVDVVLHLVRDRHTGARRLTQLGVVHLDAQKQATVEIAIGVGADQRLVPGPGWETLARRLGWEPRLLGESPALIDAGEPFFVAAELRDVG